MPKTGKTDDAIAAYRTLLEQNSEIYEARINLALLLDQSGKRAEAAEQFEKALAMRPDDGQAELNLARLYLQGNDVDKAYPHLIRIVDRGAASPEIYAALSEIEHDRKNESKSREYPRKSDSARSEQRQFLAVSSPYPITKKRTTRKQRRSWSSSPVKSRLIRIIFSCSGNRTKSSRPTPSRSLRSHNCSELNRTFRMRMRPSALFSMPRRIGLGRRRRSLRFVELKPREALRTSSWRLAWIN